MAAAVPPIDVHCVHAGPDAPVQGPAAHPLVVATAVLRWGPVAAAPSGAARVQLPHHAMLRVFGRRLRLAAPPAGTPAPMVCPLDLALTGTAWARFLNELLTCGLLDAAPFSSWAALQLVEGDAPWTVIAYLSGMLGPCLGQAERDRAGDVVRIGVDQQRLDAVRFQLQGDSTRGCVSSGNQHAVDLGRRRVSASHARVRGRGTTAPAPPAPVREGRAPKGIHSVRVRVCARDIVCV